MSRMQDNRMFTDTLLFGVMEVGHSALKRQDAAPIKPVGNMTEEKTSC